MSRVMPNPEAVHGQMQAVLGGVVSFRRVLDWAEGSPEQFTAILHGINLATEAAYGTERVAARLAPAIGARAFDGAEVVPQLAGADGLHPRVKALLPVFRRLIVIGESVRSGLAEPEEGVDHMLFPSNPESNAGDVMMGVLLNAQGAVVSSVPERAGPADDIIVAGVNGPETQELFSTRLGAQGLDWLAEPVFDGRLNLS